jgi:hypothetical protein
MCHAAQFNLSYKSLISFNACETLRNLKTENPKFWAELTVNRSEEPVADGQGAEEDNVDAQAAQFDDNSNLPCETIIAHVHGHQVAGVKVQGGHLVSRAVMETINYNGEKSDWANDVTALSSEGSSSSGPGKRKVTANKLYDGDHFRNH